MQGQSQAGDTTISEAGTFSHHPPSHSFSISGNQCLVEREPGVQTPFLGRVISKMIPGRHLCSRCWVGAGSPRWWRTCRLRHDSLCHLPGWNSQVEAGGCEQTRQHGSPGGNPPLPGELRAPGISRQLGLSGARLPRHFYFSASNSRRP